MSEITALTRFQLGPFNLLSKKSSTAIGMPLALKTPLRSSSRFASIKDGNDKINPTALSAIRWNSIHCPFWSSSPKRQFAWNIPNALTGVPSSKPAMYVFEGSIVLLTASGCDTEQQFTSAPVSNNALRRTHSPSPSSVRMFIRHLN